MFFQHEKTPNFIKKSVFFLEFPISKRGRQSRFTRNKNNSKNTYCVFYTIVNTTALSFESFKAHGYGNTNLGPRSGPLV
jgi:hypothetical protein